MKRLLITIDGPAGAGKSTVSRMLADRIGCVYIDTGALYRGVALSAVEAGISHDDDDGLEKLCGSMEMKFDNNEKGLRLFVNRVDITGNIRTPEISMMSSAVSARPVVRKYLLDLQREMGREKGVVFEGRDMGSVVFPDADFKFYLDASLKNRALRRFRELSNEKGRTVHDVEREMHIRDENDSKRDLAPLKPAPEAVIIDSTEMTAGEVVDRMISCIGGQ